MLSIVIPAHYESAVIGRCLSAVTSGAAPGELEVIVVANGCTDDTAAIARAFGGCVKVIETTVASKSNALNLGDQAASASAFPRFYIDADVVLSIDSLRKLAATLGREEAADHADHADDVAEGGRDTSTQNRSAKPAQSAAAFAVAPLPRFELAGCGWFARAYYDIHTRLPAFREGIGGSGVYGLSKAGRSRFERFPDVTADDGFVRLQFAPAERETLFDCRSIVFAPRTLGELIAIKTRSHYGTQQLRRLYPELLARNLGAGNSAALRGLLFRPWLWAKLAAYAYVKIAARLRSRRMMRGAGPVRWERDHTSRLPTSPLPMPEAARCAEEAGIPHVALQSTATS